MDNANSDAYNQDRYLRLKLLSGQILLAGLVSIIFLIIGHGNTKEFGKTIELNYNRNLIEHIAERINNFSTFNTQAIVTFIESHYQDSFASDFTVLSVCQADDCVTWSNNPKIGTSIPEKAQRMGNESLYQDESQKAYLFLTEETEKGITISLSKG